MSAKTINPLVQLVQGALVLRHCWEEQASSSAKMGNGALVRFPQGTAVEDLPTHRRQTLYPSLEHAGTAGLYAWLLTQKYRVVFANDLAYTIHGIDAIAYDARRSVYLICEAKGTGNAFKSPQQYLLDTQSGFQLSWQWCWRSLVNFAMKGPTARAFLEVYKPMIRQENVERLLAVTRANAVTRGCIVRETRVWDEKTLHTIKRLRVRKNWRKHRRWLAEVESL